MEIKARKKNDERVVTVNYEIPESLADLVAKFGEGPVVSAATDSFVIGVQALCRRHWGKTDAEIQAQVDAHKPGVRTPAVKQTAFEKASSALSALSAEERAELLNKLKALGQQKKAA